MSARWAALRILSDLREGRRTARECIDDLVSCAQLAPEEVGLTTELVMGCARHRLTLSKILGTYTTQGWQRVGRRLQHTLMLGAYQLIWLDSIPAFAAVNEAVNQAKAEGGTRTGRFVNAVLRQLVRDIEHQRLPADEGDPMRSVPVSREQCCQLRRAVFSDPAGNPVAHLAEITSHPSWLVGRWMSHYGRKAAEAICLYGMERPVVLLRPNRLRTTASELAGRLRQEGFPAETTPAGGVAVPGSAVGVLRSRSFEQGLFQPQDPTAMKAAKHMNLDAGQTVIDLCAGVGTKTGQMAEQMVNRGIILACDKQQDRLELLEANCRRLGVTIAHPVPGTNLESEASNLERIDWILIDAPCSNTGVLARRPEARYRVDRRTIEGLTAIQRDLLDLASRLARPETRLLYSTCSLEPEENEGLTESFAHSHREWRLVASELTLPSAFGAPATWHDGGYWASWARI